MTPIGADEIRGSSHAVLMDSPTVSVPATMEHCQSDWFKCGPRWFRYVYRSTRSRVLHNGYCGGVSSGMFSDREEHSKSDGSLSEGSTYSLVVDHLFLRNLPELQKDANELFLSVQSGLAMTFREAPINPLSVSLVQSHVVASS